VAAPRAPIGLTQLLARRCVCTAMTRSLKTFSPACLGVLLAAVLLTTFAVSASATETVITTRPTVQR
jgi:hypothetical protein